MPGSAAAGRRRTRSGVVGLYRYAFRLAPGVAAGSIAGGGAGRRTGRGPAAAARPGRGVAAGGGGRRAVAGPSSALLLAFLLSVALAQVVRTPQTAFADANGAAREKDMLLRLNKVTGADPDQSSLDDPERMSTIRQLWDRQWEAGMGMQIATGPLLEQVLTTAGVAVALALVLPWWVSVVLVLATARPGRGLPPDGPGRVRGVGGAVRAAEAVDVRLPAGHGAGGQGAADLRPRVLLPAAVLGPADRGAGTVLAAPPDADRRPTCWSAPAGWPSVSARSPTQGGSPPAGGWTSPVWRRRSRWCWPSPSSEVWASGQVTRGATVLRWMDELEPAVTPRSVLRVRPVLDEPVATRPAGTPRRPAPRRLPRSCSTRSVSATRAATGSSSTG